MSAETEKVIYSAKALGAAVGVSDGTIDLMRKAGRILGDPLSRYATASDVMAWLKRWPMFVARDWAGERWKLKKERYTSLGHRAALADRCDEQP